METDKLGRQRVHYERSGALHLHGPVSAQQQLPQQRP